MGRRRAFLGRVIVGGIPGTRAPFRVTKFSRRRATMAF